MFTIDYVFRYQVEVVKAANSYTGQIQVINPKDGTICPISNIMFWNWAYDALYQIQNHPLWAQLKLTLKSRATNHKPKITFEIQHDLSLEETVQLLQKALDESFFPEKVMAA